MPVPNFEQIARQLVDDYLPEAMAGRSITLHITEKLRQVWNARGQLVWDRPATELELPAASGLYFVVVETRRERKTFKIVR